MSGCVLAVLTTPSFTLTSLFEKAQVFSLIALSLSLNKEVTAVHTPLSKRVTSSSLTQAESPTDQTMASPTEACEYFLVFSFVIKLLSGKLRR